jgi:hypothetical protein
MAQKPTPTSREAPAKARPNGAKARNGSAKSLAGAREDLLARGARGREGAMCQRSDPLGDVKAARAVAQLAQAHSAELARRGLPVSYSDAALQLASEIEDHLQAVPAAAIAARARTPEQAELVADAAATAQRVRDAVLRVTRGPEGRRVAHAFGLGEPFSARQPQHVLRAIERILDGAGRHPECAHDAGLIPEDLQTMRDLAAELRELPGAGAPLTDEAAALLDAQFALRAYFDLVAAKATLALAADPEERMRVLSLLPRAEERRHARRTAEAQASASAEA